jgi:hypothetical protein
MCASVSTYLQRSAVSFPSRQKSSGRIFCACDISDCKATKLCDVRPSILVLNTDNCEEPKDGYNGLLRTLVIRLLNYVVSFGNTVFYACLMAVNVFTTTNK